MINEFVKRWKQFSQKWTRKRLKEGNYQELRKVHKLYKKNVKRNMEQSSIINVQLENKQNVLH